jgi:hypothetical protein
LSRSSTKTWAPSSRMRRSCAGLLSKLCLVSCF